jgi:hypothetical protein
LDLQLPVLSVPITTNVVSSNTAQARCTPYNIMWLSLSVNCDRSVVFSCSPVSSFNKTVCHDLAEILLKVELNTINLNKPDLHLYLSLLCWQYFQIIICLNWWPHFFFQTVDKLFHDYDVNNNNVLDPTELANLNLYFMMRIPRLGLKKKGNS